MTTRQEIARRQNIHRAREAWEERAADRHQRLYDALASGMTRQEAADKVGYTLGTVEHLISLKGWKEFQVARPVRTAAELREVKAMVDEQAAVVTALALPFLLREAVPGLVVAVKT